MQLPLEGLEEQAVVARVRPGRKPRVNETVLSEEDRENIRKLIQERDRLPSGPTFRQQRLNIGTKIWNIRHPEYVRDPEKRNAARKKWLTNNRELRKKVALDWYYRNRPPLKEREFAPTAPSLYLRQRRIRDNAFALAGRLRATMNRAFRRRWVKKPFRTESLLGCTVEEAKSHIERQFVNGMSWSNRGSFVIDHIIPVAAFDLRDTEESQFAFNWRNLRPITHHENAVKSDTLPDPLPSWLPSHIADRIRTRQPKHPTV